MFNAAPGGKPIRVMRMAVNEWPDEGRTPGFKLKGWVSQNSHLDTDEIDSRHIYLKKSDEEFFNTIELCDESLECFKDYIESEDKRNGTRDATYNYYTDKIKWLNKRRGELIENINKTKKI